MKAKEFPLESEIISNSSYMDDIIDSVDTVESALKITKNITDILKWADFHIKNWVISSEKKDLSIGFGLFHFLDGIERVLGMSWLVVSSKKKGMILSQVNGIFDPLGLVAPFIIKRKNIIATFMGSQREDGLR